jgi:hypothetical protein
LRTATKQKEIETEENEISSISMDFQGNLINFRKLNSFTFSKSGKTESLEVKQS